MARYTAQAATCKSLIKKYHLHTKHWLLVSNNVSAFYKHINNKMSSSQGSAPIRTENGTILQNEASKAGAFNAYFASVFNDNISRTIPSGHRNNRIVSVDVDFFPEIVFKALQSAKRSISSSSDSIPSIFWANVVAAVTFPVSIIFSLYKYSVLPFNWKCVTVLPLFKKGDPS